MQIKMLFYVNKFARLQHFVDLNWDSTIDTIIGTYFLLGLPCTILGIVQLVLAVVCLPEMRK